MCNKITQVLLLISFVNHKVNGGRFASEPPNIGVVGGHNVTDDQLEDLYSHQGAVISLRRNLLLGGATIVSPQKVITAAHVVDDAGGDSIRAVWKSRRICWRYNEKCYENRSTSEL